MQFLEAVAVMGALAIMLTVGGWIAVSLWRQGWDVARPVLLDRVLRRQSEDAARLAIASGSSDFMQALHRCIDCREAAKCRAWLASGVREGFQSFCPNAEYVERMRRLAD